MHNTISPFEYWQWRQGDFLSDLMTEADARYWAQRQNNRTSSIDNEAQVRRVVVDPWQVQDDAAAYDNHPNNTGRNQ